MAGERKKQTNYSQPEGEIEASKSKRQREATRNWPVITLPATGTWLPLLLLLRQRFWRVNVPAANFIGEFFPPTLPLLRHYSRERTSE